MDNIENKIKWEIEAIASECPVCMKIKQLTGLVLIDSREVSKRIAAMVKKHLERKLSENSS